MASRVQGKRRVRKLLKVLPDALSQEIVVELNIAGRELAAAIRGRTPARTGALRAGVGYRVQPKYLRLIVGLVSTPAGRAKLFYGRIQDLGRKAQTVTVTRFHKGARATGTGFVSGGRKRGDVSTYAMNVRSMPGKHFVSGRYPELRRSIGDNLRAIYDRALATAAGSAASEGDA